MSNSETVLDVGDKEWLARYIFSSSHIRPSDSTVRSDAFMPPPDLRLSVTRHLSVSEAEIWTAGKHAGANRPTATLYGRADFEALLARNQSLDIKPDPLLDNQGHAVVIGWPIGKPEQKIIALELARSARFVANPQS